MTTNASSIIFCRDCKYEPIAQNFWKKCPQCGGSNLEARYPVAQAETLESTVTIPRILLERILAEYLASELEHWETNGKLANHIYLDLIAVAQFMAGEIEVT